ncbi:colanic acid biosynthesis glycosyl transferase WcaI [Bradyrhizobium sp. USDA 4509]
MTTILVTQHYRPDDTSTAVFLTAIAEEISREDELLVISGTKGSRAKGNPTVSEVPAWNAPKAALVRRALAMLWFCIVAFALVFWRARPSSPVFVVTTPFLLPYFVALAARLRGAPSGLIVYDLYPESLIAGGIVTRDSIAARLIRRMNSWMFKALDTIVVIGRDMEKHITPQSPSAATKICYIPHWSTLPPCERAIDQGNAFRKGIPGKLVVGLSGNLGFTHDPKSVFDAAQKLAGDASIHFILSGWGVGWKQLVAYQKAASLPNVTLIERVPEDQLELLLTAADAWIIPYRRNMSGISVPSRLYNLLAIGRPIIALTEADSELALMLASHDAGWVVEPETPSALASIIAAIAQRPNELATKRRNAVKALSEEFTRDAAGTAYRELIRRLHVTRTSE